MSLVCTEKSAANREDEGRDDTQVRRHARKRKMVSIVSRGLIQVLFCCFCNITGKTGCNDDAE